MRRILDIALKDLLQIMRDKKTFLFLLIMPIAFTFLFGFAFGGFSKGEADTRLKVAVIDEDNSEISRALVERLGSSEVISVVDGQDKSLADHEKAMEKGKLAGILVIPQGYEADLLTGNLPTVGLTVDLAQPAGTTIQTEVLGIVARVLNAARTAMIVGEKTSAFTPAFQMALIAWENPPIRIESTAALIEVEEQPSQKAQSMAHTSPGMILQFAIAGLLTCSTVIVNERKTRALQRLLTTATERWHILFGHFLAIFCLIFSQFVVLILFGQFILQVDYLRLPAATLLVAVTASLCIAAMGLLVGVLAKSEEQAIVFSLVPMFIFSGLGGAWTPLEYTSTAFQAIGHLTPVAWGMDGFKNITVRLLDPSSVLLPSAALAGYALAFFLLAVWRFRKVSE